MIVHVLKVLSDHDDRCMRLSLSKHILIFHVVSTVLRNLSVPSVSPTFFGISSDPLLLTTMFYHL